MGSCARAVFLSLPHKVANKSCYTRTYIYTCTNIWATADEKLKQHSTDNGHTHPRHNACLYEYAGAEHVAAIYGYMHMYIHIHTYMCTYIPTYVCGRICEPQQFRSEPMLDTVQGMESSRFKLAMRQGIACCILTLLSLLDGADRGCLDVSCSLQCCGLESPSGRHLLRA